MINPEEPQAARNCALLNLGFRPFFLAAAGYGAVVMALWLAIYTFSWSPDLYALSPVAWHAHEMIYGYAMAVIAGFLLTAVRNWTGRPTPQGLPLALLVSLWLAGRILPFFGPGIPLQWVAVTDCAFAVCLVLATGLPIVQARQWKNLPILIKLALLLASNVLFYLGALHSLDNGIRLGLYSGFYLVLALILTLGRRLIPFFIERGVGYSVRLTNRKWLDLTSMVVFLLFWLSELFTPDRAMGSVLSAILFVLHSLRLAGWHTRGIWHKPLLWVLYAAYGLITAAFALKAAAYPLAISPFLAVHLFAVGGIGLMTVGMMARVALGHTGRDIASPPPVVVWVFALMLASTITRVLLPLLDPGRYSIWIGLSQALWIGCFAVFFVTYLPILVRPRVDGRPG